MRRLSWLLGGAAAAALASCSIYGTDLVGSGGSAGSSSSSSGSSSSTSSSSTSSTSTSSSSSTSTSSSSASGMPCSTVTDCPGESTECQTLTCSGGLCGVNNTVSGTVLSSQTAGDCKLAICDGSGDTTTIPDNNDAQDDGNDCTTDGCAGGSPTHTPKSSGTPCATGGGKVCNASGQCVECAANTDCASQVCKNDACVAAGCGDNTKNGGESDVDCGGPCPGCPFGKTCGTNADCKGGDCTGGTCAATCTDGEKNQSESDVDCGGASCPVCTAGKACKVGADCQSGTCTGNVCVDVLLIGEVQTRGDAGGNDDFIEIYNPNTYAVTFDSAWEVWTRNAASSACAALNKRISGAGQSIPAHGHLLYVNSGAYNGATAADGTYTSGFTDSGQIVLLRGGALVDSLCYYFNATTQNNLTCASPPAMWFACNGAVSNAPHNDTTGGSSNTDVSLERKPGGSLGNGTNTGDNASDWNSMVTSNPQNLASPPTP